MLSRTECWDLMTAIKHLDHRTADQNDAILFGQIVNKGCGPTLAQCLDALVEWHTRTHDFGLIAPEDIIDVIKSHRPSHKLTEAEIGRMIEHLDLTDVELWEVRRELIAGVNSGLPRDRALARALDAAHGRQLPSKPSKPMPTHVHRFAGSGKLRIRDVIGGDTR